MNATRTALVSASVAGTYNNRIVFLKFLAYYTRILYFSIDRHIVRDVLYANGNFNSSRTKKKLGKVRLVRVLYANYWILRVRQQFGSKKFG